MLGGWDGGERGRETGRGEGGCKLHQSCFYVSVRERVVARGVRPVCASHPPGRLQGVIRGMVRGRGGCVRLWLCDAGLTWDGLAFGWELGVLFLVCLSWLVGGDYPVWEGEVVKGGEYPWADMLCCMMRTGTWALVFISWLWQRHYDMFCRGPICSFVCFDDQWMDGE